MNSHPIADYLVTEIEYHQERIARDYARSTRRPRFGRRHPSPRLEVVPPYGDARA